MFQAHLSKVSPEVTKESEWSSQVVDHIDRILKEKGITQRELAARIGCNETQIVRWTRGFPNYTRSTLAKLSVALGEDLVKVDCTNSIVTGYQPSNTNVQHCLSDSASPSYGSKQTADLKAVKSYK